MKASIGSTSPGIMAEMDAGVSELHLAVCRRFGDAVRSADGKMTCCYCGPRLKPERPCDNPQRRWELTFHRLHEALGRLGWFQRVVELPAVGKNPAANLDARKLVPTLTQDVLMHTWDLARAVGADDRLDPGWCAVFFDQLPADPNALTASGMFVAPVAVDDQADTQSKLLAGCVPKSV